MKILAKIIKTSATIAALSATAAIITGIVFEKAYKYYNAKHNITRMLCYINIYIICINYVY